MTEQPIGSVDCAALLAAMTYTTDVRKAPDARRHARFTAGWDAAVTGTTYRDSTLQQLTWDNLGWRLGDMLGPATDSQMHDHFEAFARMWREGNPRVGR